MVSLEDIFRLSEKIVRDFQPERVILFGSHAYGNPGPDSDVDLLVILPFEGRNFWKSLETSIELSRRSLSICWRAAQTIPPVATPRTTR